MRSARGSLPLLVWMALALASFAGLPAGAQTAAAQSQAVTSGATTFTYDANGNRTSKLEAGIHWTYVYDVRDRLVEVRRDGELVESYGYDYLDRRIVKAGAGQLTRYLWDEGRLLLELDEAGSTIARYEHGGRRLLGIDHATEGYGAYVFDGSASPVGILRPDGTLQIRTSWNAWGVASESAGDSASPFGFTGHQFDEVTGLYYAGARYYDPLTGLFLTEDPEFGELETPASLHRYLYAYANPTTYWDPDGRESIRQLLDPEADFMADRLWRGSSKYIGYQLWNAFTFGFVGEHDQAYESSSGAEYAVDAALALAKAGAKAYVVAQTAGAGAAFTQSAGIGAVTGAALTGAAIGVTHTATDDVFRLAEGSPTHSARDYAIATATGGALGGLGGRLARPPPAAAPPPALTAADIRAQVFAEAGIVERQAASPWGAASARGARPADSYAGDFGPRGAGPTGTIVEGGGGPGVAIESFPSAPALPSQVATRGLPIVNRHFTPDAPAVLQDLTSVQARRLAADPSLAKSVLSPLEYAAGQRLEWVARMQYGNALERLVAREIGANPLHRSLFEHLGGASRPDFRLIPRSGAAEMNFDITTQAQVKAHLARPRYGLGLNVITYQRPSSFRLFPR